VELSEYERHALERIETALRQDDPRLDKALRRMRPVGETASVGMVLAVLVAVGAGLASVTIGGRVGSALLIALGVTIMVAIPVAAAMVLSRRYYCNHCHRPSPVSVGRCPHCVQLAV
jgi:ABC-type transport system involved in cytochrome bd biosynthesis fused ATPase/permease subunit